MHNINVPLYQFSIFVFLVTKCTNFWKKKNNNNNFIMGKIVYM